MTDPLESLRKQINDVDHDLVRLLNDRVKLAQKIGAQKKKGNGEIYVPSREKDVFDRVLDLNPGPLPPKSLRAIYREIMSASLALEHDMVITYLGSPSTFTHQASRAKFGGSVTYQPCINISDVFQAVEDQTADYGVVPCENSTEGSVTHTLDEFPETSAVICAEMYMSIEFHLFSRFPLDEIKTVYSNLNALGQCRRWLTRKLPSVQQISVPSMTQAAEEATRHEGAAVICNTGVSEDFDLPIRAEHIEDVSGNRMRFLVIGRSFSQATGEDKTAILFSVPHRVGSLHDALKIIRDHQLNMTHIEFRPSMKKEWEYVFFIDLEGHVDDEPVQNALAELRSHCTLLKTLGSFPKAHELAN